MSRFRFAIERVVRNHPHAVRAQSVGSAVIVCAMLAQAGGLPGSAPFLGSTIVSISASGFQPTLVYKKFPSEEQVGPSDVWQLAIGVAIPGAPATLQARLRLAVPGDPAGIEITDDEAVFVTGSGLLNNYAPAERFQLVYTGALDPFVGAIDFVLEPDGHPAVPVRVHLGITEQTGFPIAIRAHTFALPPVGNVSGDTKNEILLSGITGDVSSLHAFDHAGQLLPGWPIVNDEPGVISHSFATPNLADLDQDGLAEIVVTGSLQRETRGAGATGGFEVVQTLGVFDGAGDSLWQIEGDFESYPAIGDIDGNGDSDILIGAEGNLRRYESDGTQVVGWKVEGAHAINVEFPVIADVDGDPSNGLEIVANAKVFGPQARSEITVWNRNGLLHGPLWPRVLPISPQPVTVVDLDSDPSNGLEILFAIDHTTNPPEDPETGFLNTFSIHAWHADGSVVAGWPHHFMRDPGAGFFDDRMFFGCSAGDLDGDGDVEIVMGTYGQGDAANGNIFVFHHDGTLDPSWPRWAGIAQTPSVWGGPALGDLDGDGALEIVTASFTGTYVFRANGDPFPGFPKMSRDVFTQPVIADLDADGTVEIVQATLFDGLVAWSMSAPTNDARPWPQFRRNPGNTGALPTVAPAIDLVRQLRFVDKTALTWSAASGASSYDVMRGSLDALAQDQSVGEASCIADDLPSEAGADVSTPPLGSGFYYMVRGDGPATPAGSFNDPAGGRQVRSRDPDVGSSGGTPCSP